MDLELSDDQFELRDNIRSVLEGACPPSVVRAVYENEGTSAELWQQMVELYWPALGVAEDAGGLGMGFVEVGLLAEELGRATAPGPLLAMVTQYIPMVEAAGATDALAAAIAGEAIAQVREQYDRVIGSFQALKHRFADMYLAVERANAVGYYAALAIAEDAPDRAEAVHVAKAAAGDCQRLLAQDGLQLHGGIGYTWENDLHFLLKRAKAGDVLCGGRGFHRTRLAALLGLGEAA
jgi:alkylation response protein AidB-like acyl-CoA dehydrogenase